MYSIARAFAARIYERDKPRKIGSYMHFQAKMAQSSLCQCTASPEFSLLTLNEKKKWEIWFVSHFEATKAQLSLCQMHSLA